MVNEPETTPHERHLASFLSDKVNALTDLENQLRQLVAEQEKVKNEAQEELDQARTLREQAAHELGQAKAERYEEFRRPPSISRVLRQNIVHLRCLVLTGLFSNFFDVLQDCFLTLLSACSRLLSWY